MVSLHQNLVYLLNIIIVYKKCVHAQLLNCIWLFATPWTIASRFLCPWDSPGQNTGLVQFKNTGVGCYFLLQGTFLTQGSNPCLPVLAAWFFTTVHLGSRSLSVQCFQNTRLDLLVNYVPSCTTGVCVLGSHIGIVFFSLIFNSLPPQVRSLSLSLFYFY